MQTLKLYNKLKDFPGGRRIFTWGVCRTAPYFASIRPLTEDLRPGYARVTMKKRRKVENHIHTVHAIAMCNLAEIVMGLVTEVSIPPGARWIPVGMTVAYLRKATTDMTGSADVSHLDWSGDGNFVVPVKVTDTQQQLVFTADITVNIKHAGASRAA